MIPESSSSNLCDLNGVMNLHTGREFQRRYLRDVPALGYGVWGMGVAAYAMPFPIVCPVCIIHREITWIANTGVLLAIFEVGQRKTAYIGIQTSISAAISYSRP